MLKEIPERITYAQKKLLDLIERRELKKWCKENGFTHTTVYFLAYGKNLPTYTIACSMADVIAPAEWLFYTDEPLPYEAETVPKWDSKQPSKFISAHKKDYKDFAKAHGLAESTAYNMFVSHTTKPNLSFIRQMCAEVNPLDFFVAPDETADSATKPTVIRGDIVRMQGDTLLVLATTSAFSFIGSRIASYRKDGIALQGTSVQGFVNPSDILTVSYQATKPEVIDTLPNDIMQTVLGEVRKFFV